MSVAAQKHGEIVKPRDDALQLHAVDQEDRDRHLVLPDVIEKHVLDALVLFGGHLFAPYSCSSQWSSCVFLVVAGPPRTVGRGLHSPRSEEHTSELPSLMRISYSVFCLQ